MPLARVEIEQTSPTTWVAEVELGGLSARRKHLRADSAQQIMHDVAEALATMDERHPMPELFDLVVKPAREAIAAFARRLASKKALEEKKAAAPIAVAPVKPAKPKIK